ncbi:hypothetical protein AB1Y20_003771 [Prymnesium parvum]|uniref:Uncharacterized protein n=1 Tax=Prymnesium parvum TaxID=97485 RepID=A0AB34J7T7_PRYPA
MKCHYYPTDTSEHALHLMEVALVHMNTDLQGFLPSCVNRYAHLIIRRRAAPPARRERAAFALTAILPWASAGFILGDSEAMITNRPADETISRLIRALSTYGASSVDAAQSTLGRLMSWVVVHHPEARVVEGSHVSDFLAQDRPSAATLASLAWLRDHCGLAIPARGPACRPYKGRPPAATHTKESLSLDAVVGLEFLATHHPSALVRGQAGGWSLLVRLALRVEQAQSCVLNAVVRHEFQGKLFTFVVGAVRRDKNPNPAQRRPRPVWGVIDGLDSPDCLYRALQEMLSGVESSRFLIRDTDRPHTPRQSCVTNRALSFARFDSIPSVNLQIASPCRTRPSCSALNTDLAAASLHSAACWPTVPLSSSRRAL